MWALSNFLRKNLWVLHFRTSIHIQYYIQILHYHKCVRILIITDEMLTSLACLSNFSPPLCYSIFITTHLYLPCYSRKYSTHRVRQITTKRWRMTEIVNHLSSILDKSSTKENICDENLAYIYDKVEDFTNQILQKKRRGNAFR